jgi:putative peptidoglycan lipid II flippase
MGTVLVRELSQAARKEDAAAVAHAESRALELAAGLALPAALGLIVLAEPIVRLLFEHGAFTASDTAATARALMWLALGLPAQVLFKALAPAFFARENTTTPLISVLKGAAFALAAGFLFGHFFGAEGIAAGIALGAWSSALSLLREGATRFGFAIDTTARRRLPRIAAAALTMAAATWWMLRFLPPAGLAQAIALAALIAGGIAIYGLLLQLFGVTGWRETVNALKGGHRDLRG